MAIKAYGDLKSILPQLLFILARLICWKARDRSGPSHVASYADLTDRTDVSLAAELEQAEKDEKKEELSRLDLPNREDLTWERLQHSFDQTSAPSPKQYFAVLYYLFPCSTLTFLRRPASYLKEHGAESPFSIGWDKALDEAHIKTESEVEIFLSVIKLSLIR